MNTTNKELPVLTWEGGYICTTSEGGRTLDVAETYIGYEHLGPILAASTGLLSAAENLAHEVRYMLSQYPERRGGKYEQRLNEMDAAITKARATR